MIYQPTYSKEEMKAIVAWFEQHEAELPQEMQIDEANYTSNLPKTVKALIGCLRHRHITPLLSGEAHFLFKIKENIENGTAQ